MIKRTGALLLTLLYAVTTLGIVVNMHYCGRLLVSVRVNAPSKHCIGESHMKNCTDKHFAVKVKDAHQSTSFSFSPKIFGFDVLPAVFADHSFAQQHYFAGKLLGRAPPDLPADNVRTFIKNCIFRI